MAEKTKKAPAAPELYKIHSLVRDVSTRLHRATSPTRHRFTMLLGGGLIRVTRKRPATVTKATVLRLQPELIAKEERGMLMLTDMVGRRVDITSLEVTGILPPEPAAPHPPLDTAATDNPYPIGEPKPMFRDGLTADATVEPPEITKPDLPEGEDDVDGEEGEESDEETSEPSVVPGEVVTPEEPALVAAKRKRRRGR